MSNIVADPDTGNEMIIRDDSPRQHKKSSKRIKSFNRVARSVPQSPLHLRKKNLKIFTGSSRKEHEHAANTYLNATGPGTYDLPSLTGRHSLNSKLRNPPKISLASHVKAPWHAGYHVDFVGLTSPPSTRYSPMLGIKSGDRSTTQMGIVGSEKKFREPTSVTNLKKQLPVQYGGSYNIDSCNNGFQDVLKKVNGKTILEIESLH